MKKISKIFFTIFAFSIVIMACKKEEVLPYYAESTNASLTASKTTIAATAADSNNVVLILNWTNPMLSTDSAHKMYVVEIDSTGRGFAKAVKYTLSGVRTKSFTGKQLNDILLGFGFNFNVAYGVDVRVTSSYANNNDIKISNTLKLTTTAYKVPPKVALPASNRLFFVGDASATLNSWSNNAPLPAVRELTRLDETTWGGILELTGGGAYLITHTEGAWGKYSITNGAANTADAGSFGSELLDNFPGAVSAGAGFYKMVYDFQRGKYAVTKQANALPTEIYITGDATNDGWTNAPSAAQKFTAVTNGVWEITMPFVSGKYYKFLSNNGAWQPQFGGNSATGGEIGANYGGGNDPAPVPTPAIAGNYKIQDN